MDKRRLAIASMAVVIEVIIGNRSTAAPAGYVPGLGEFMTATQMRHPKLWFAGQSGNWPLAAYELDEIKEGFEEITKLHPTHPGRPVPIREILPRLMAGGNPCQTSNGDNCPEPGKI